jgi:hypothetical protein
MVDMYLPDVNPKPDSLSLARTHTHTKPRNVLELMKSFLNNIKPCQIAKRFVFVRTVGCGH